jgi:hypothetical protein
VPTAVTRAHDVADGLFEVHASVFGTDLGTYRGHVHRVIDVVGLQREVPDAVARPLGLAAFFHDAAIWFDHTWDYLSPSVERATAALGAQDERYSALVAAMISEHHRLRPARHDDPLVEAFRRADLTDVTGGIVRAPGVSRDRYRALLRAHPSRGFRPMLLRAFGRGLREAPLRPLPMLKL